MQLGAMQWGTLEYIFAIFAIATAVGYSFRLESCSVFSLRF